MSKLRVLLADDHKMVREGLEGLVNGQPDMEVVGEADTGAGAVALALDLQPDVVVMDISMPDVNGLQAAEQLRDVCPQVKVMALTRHVDDGYVEQLLAAGASGYVLKQSSADVLLRAIRTIAAGQPYLDPALKEHIVAKVIDRHLARRTPSRRFLSPREEEVLRLVARGYLNKEVAARLQISVKTAETHKANAMEKMGMKNRVDILRYALLQGWLEDT